ncbi:malonyl-CoA decarboxylase [Alsobacter sp. SYSU BS001988]
MTNLEPETPGAVAAAAPGWRQAVNISFFSDLLQSIADRGRAIITSGRLGGGKDLAGLCAELLSSRGEASGVALAREVLDRYDLLDDAGKCAFLRELVLRFGAEPKQLERAIEAYRAAPDHRTLLDLHKAAEPRRQELIRRLNLSPGGTLRLVRMREELFRHQREHPELEALDADFQHLFSSWFNRGFLVLRPIDWSTPANILEKIIRYEAVHAIESWDDLRRRLQPADRRCFAFFHPQVVDEPLIFVEVALTSEIPGGIGGLLAEDRAVIEPRQANTAVFYSISNCQEGLRGISFGNFLIKQVVEELARQVPTLKAFVTLSPVPGFASWLARERRNEASQALTREDKTVLEGLDQEGWAQDPARLPALRRTLTEAAAYYFLRAKTPGGRPVDPVARFHLGNGARLERINWLGDASRKGMAQAHGLMVNYLYDLDDIERNHEAFVNKGRVAAASSVRGALRSDLPSRDVVPLQ